MPETTNYSPNNAVAPTATPQSVTNFIHGQLRDAKAPLVELGMGAWYSLVLQAYSSNPDMQKISQNIRTILGLGALANVANGVETRFLNMVQRKLEGGMNEETARAAAMENSFNKAVALSKPDFGLSQCEDAGKLLKNSGVTGEVCAGIGFGGAILPDFKKYGAGITAKIQF